MTITHLDDTFNKIETEIRSGAYSIPYHLLRKMNPSVQLDKECLGYVLGVDGGGYYYQWLALLTRYLRPRCFLELGNRYGASTTMIYSELPPESRLISVDIQQDQRYVPEEVWQDPRVRFVFGDCLDINIYGDEIPIDIDVLWTDTVHFYEQVRNEFDVYEPLLADEALIIVDDILVSDKGRFFKEASCAKYDLTALCHGSGFGVLHYVREPSQRCSLETRIKQAALASARVWKHRFDALKAEVDYVKSRQVSARLRRHLQLLRPVYSPIVSLLRSQKVFWASKSNRKERKNA